MLSRSLRTINEMALIASEKGFLSARDNTFQPNLRDTERPSR